MHRCSQVTIAKTRASFPVLAERMSRKKIPAREDCKRGRPCQQERQAFPEKFSTDAPILRAMSPENLQCNVAGEEDTPLWSPREPATECGPAQPKAGRTPE